MSLLVLLTRTQKPRPFLANRTLRSTHLPESLVSSDSFQPLLTLRTITPVKKLFLPSPGLWSLLSFGTVYGGNPCAVVPWKPKRQSPSQGSRDEVWIQGGAVGQTSLGQFGEEGGREEPTRHS